MTLGAGMLNKRNKIHINYIQWTSKVLILQYILPKKSLHRFNTLAQSFDVSSREYLRDHLKERLRNR